MTISSKNSKYACKKLTNNIKQQKQSYESDLKVHKKITNEIIKKTEAKNHAIIKQLRKKMPVGLLRANDLAQMKGASNWLTSLPLEDENYILNKRKFFDALFIRCHWKLKRVPSICAYGKQFDIDHAMSRLEGGFIHQRHDIVRDALAKFFSEVCTYVKIEPALMPLTGEVLPKSMKSSDNARLDIAARSFWQRGERLLFDIRVVEVEHGSFTSFVSTHYGGYGREAERCISQFAILI